MIQRIQSIFLLVIVALSALQFIFPLFEFTLFKITSQVFITTLDNWMMYIPLALNSIVAILAIVCLLTYKNRQLQMRLCNYIMIDTAIMTIAFIVMTFMIARDSIPVSYKIPLVFPFANLLLAYLSKRYIKKDDDLVRSADRIR